MHCDEMQNFIAQYQQAVRAYRLAAVELIDQHGDEFLKRSMEVDRLRLVARKAYLHIERHIREHGCGYDLRTGTSG